jgi:signal transduction histidine kinase
MSLKAISRLTRRISFRLTLWYSTVFLLSTILLFMLAYVLVSSAVKDQERRMILNKMREYTLMSQAGGPAALIGAIRLESQVNQEAGFFVRVADLRNNTIVLTLPREWSAFDRRVVENVPITEVEQWLHVTDESKRFGLIIAGRLFPYGLFLQIGRGTGQLESLLEKFRRIFMGIIIPMVLIGLIGGALFAARTLHPIRDLIDTVKAIDIGQMDQRVTPSGSGDEIDELVILFNGMLAKIETLIVGMRDALANVAHDLRTPLTRMRIGVEERLQDDSDKETLREALMDCAEESERILTMLNILMDVSEADSGMLRLNVQDVNLIDYIREAAELYEYVIEDKEIDLVMDMPVELPVRADPNRLRQVLANLLDNAVKFSPNGQRVSIVAESAGDEVLIRITDQGPGIEPQDLPRIFDRLYRGDKSRSHRGMGLGLSLVQAVVHAHRGRIDVRSSLGEGSTFTVYLPARGFQTG